MTTPFPKSPTFMTIDEPFRFEGELFDLEVEGEIPASLDGTFYRVGPDQAFPPKMGDANPFNGDGIVTAFRIKDGHCDMQMKYVMTHRLKAERAARRGLFGDYRNPFTDDPSVKGVQRTVSNTNVVPHNGMLLAMKEDGPPYAMDPHHAGDEAALGLERPDDGHVVHRASEDRPGHGRAVRLRLRGEGRGHRRHRPLQLRQDTARRPGKCGSSRRYPGMIHDCAISENYIILPLIPQVMDIERLKRGGIAFQWEPSARPGLHRGRRAAARRRTCASSARPMRCPAM